MIAVSQHFIEKPYNFSYKKWPKEHFVQYLYISYSGKKPGEADMHHTETITLIQIAPNWSLAV